MSTAMTVVFVPPTATAPAWACLADDPTTAAALGDAIRSTASREVHVVTLKGKVSAASDPAVVAASVPSASPSVSAPSRPSPAAPSLALSTLVPGIRRLHVTYARGGYPDARAMVKALHDLIDLDPVLVASTCSRFFADASSTAPADLHAVLDWEFSTLAKDLADPAQEGFLYRLDRLAHGDMWTFFTTAGVGEDLCGDLLGKLADVLRFRYVSTAFFNTGIDCATL